MDHDEAINLKQRLETLGVDARIYAANVGWKVCLFENNEPVSTISEAVTLPVLTPMQAAAKSYRDKLTRTHDDWMPDDAYGRGVRHGLQLARSEWDDMTRTFLDLEKP